MKDIPKEFLPKGVGPAQYDPEMLRHSAGLIVNGMVAWPPCDQYSFPVKAYVVLTMLDEIDKLEAEVEEAEDRAEDFLSQMGGTLPQ
jgi:hypothetical protein